MGLDVRAVFFDLDNTLIDTAGASEKGMLEVTAARPQPPPGGGVARSPLPLAPVPPPPRRRRQSGDASGSREPWPALGGPRTGRSVEEARPR